MSYIIDPGIFYIATREVGGGAKERGSNPHDWQELPKMKTGYYEGSLINKSNGNGGEVFLCDLADSEIQMAGEQGVTVFADKNFDVFTYDENRNPVSLLGRIPDINIARGVTLRRARKCRQAIIIQPGAEIEIFISEGDTVVKRVAIKGL